MKERIAMTRQSIMRYFVVAAVLLWTLSTIAGGKVEVTGDTSHGTVTSKADGAVVTLTVTPQAGYYIRKSDIKATRTFMPTANARSTNRAARNSIPMPDDLALVGNDPDDLSQPRTYTVTLPGEEYDILLDVKYTQKQTVTEGMVSLSETVFVYNEQVQRPVVSVQGLMENRDYMVTYSNPASKEADTYTVTVTGYSMWAGTITRSYKIFRGGKAEVNNSLNGGTIATAVDGLTVTLTVTPADGYYIRKQDVVVAKTFMPVAAPRRTTPVADLLELTGDDPDDLSLPRTYTAQLPGWEYSAFADATFTERQTVTSSMVQLSAASFIYNGSDQKPVITVAGLTEGKDYLLDFAGTSWSDVGTYSLTVTGRSTWKGVVNKTYTITKAPSVVTVAPQPQSLIYSGSAQHLVAAGEAVGGTLMYSLDGTTYQAAIPTGVAAGSYTIYYKVKGDSNHTDTEMKSVTATITKKAIIISGIAAQNKVYDGTTAATLVYDAVVFGGMAEGDALTVTAIGTFSDANAGSGKVVTLSALTLGGASIGNYQLAESGQQTTATATITSRSIEGAVFGNIAAQSYSGEALTPVVTVTLDNQPLVGDKDYTVSYADNVNVGEATVTVTGIGNYQGAVQTKFIITPVAAVVTLAPQPQTLVYSGNAQQLVAAGEAEGGTLLYSLDGTDYQESIPTGVAAGSYTIYYKVQGDSNHTDSNPATVVVTMGSKELSQPTILLSSTSYIYDGTVKEPDVTVKDGETVIPATEYVVTYESNVNAGDAKVIITDVEGGNYIVSGEAPFTIVKADATITKEPVAMTLTYTGAPQTLIAAGESLDGNLLYSIDGVSYQTALPTGTLAGEYTVYYKVQGDANHTDTEALNLSVTIGKKDIVISGIMAQDKVYDGTTAATLVYDQVVYSGIVEGDVLTVTADGAFTDANAGADKTVSISHLTLDGASIANYQLAAEGQQSLATATISKAASSVAKAPVALSLTYTGSPQTLAESGEGAGGLMQYSLSEVGPFTDAVPTGTAAGSYTLYYMVQGDGNHLNGAVAHIVVTIAAKVVDKPVIVVSEPTFVYDGEAKCPSVTVKDGETVIPATEYVVTYESNMNAGDAKVIITDVEGGNYIVSGEAPFTIMKADAVVVTTPKALELDYNGEAQVLVSGGETIGGVLVYSLDGESYDTALPIAIEPALYTVYYKVIGDDNHFDTEVATASAVIRPQQLLYESGGEANADIVVDDEGNVNVVINELPEGFFEGTAELPTTLVDENSTEYGVTEVSSEAFNDMPSDIIVVLPEGVSTTEGVTNVVNGDGTCETMDLTDISNFDLPIDVEADKVVYVREVTNGSTTVCLPYDLPVPENTTAYFLDVTDGEGVTLQEVEGVMEAYQPYVLVVNEQSAAHAYHRTDEASAYVVDLGMTNVTFSHTAEAGSVEKDNFTFCGTMHTMTHEEGLAMKAYVLQPDNSWRITASSDPEMAQKPYLAPFQAYLLYTGHGEMDEVATTFDSITTCVQPAKPDDKVSSETGWYDLSGRKLGGKPTRKGVYLHQRKVVVH